ncbi:MAG TPA: hypothetical protein VKG24_19920 [Pseudolabrys sp.]|nr:hypothetical protein [Pseudolabrys sp.]
MASDLVQEKQRRAKTRASATESRRGLIVAVGLSSVFMLAIFVSASSYFSLERRAAGVVSKVVPLSQSPGGEDAHREAAIVLESERKGRCEERRFDNRSGKIVSSVYVDCDARLADERDTTPSENMSAQRLRSILGAFKK